MAGGYARTHKGTRADIKLPGQRRSGWENDFIRVCKYLRELGVVTHFEYETQERQFPGKDEKARGNKRVFLDCYVAWKGDLGEWLGVDLPIHDDTWDTWPAWHVELKGRLAKGGKLDNLTDEELETLDQRKDKASRIKLQRLKRHYPKDAARTVVLGAREWAFIKKTFKPLIPEWESK